MEAWRSEWACVVNRHLEKAQQPERIDYRSFADQGVDLKPTIHEGVTARVLESKGIISDRCELNRQIRADNALIRMLKDLLSVVKDVIQVFAEKLESIRDTLVETFYGQRQATAAHKYYWNQYATVALIGNDYRLSDDSELRELINKSDYRLIEIHDTKTVKEYQQMAKASHYITTYLPAVPAGQSIVARIGGTHHHLPISYDYEEIRAELKEIEKILFNDDKDHLDYAAKEAECEAYLKKALAAVGLMPIAIDYTVAPRPLSIAKLLLDRGFKVERVYADAFTKEEESAFTYLKENYPELEIIAVSRYEMRYVKEEDADKYLAIGQKAAYFSNTRHFVNEILGSGHYGYEAIKALAQDMITAVSTLSDMENIVFIKGWGCEESVCGRQQQ